MPGLQPAPKMMTRSELLGEGSYLVPFLRLVNFPAGNSPVPASSFKAKPSQRLCTLKAPACSQCVDAGKCESCRCSQWEVLHAALPPAVPVCWRWVGQRGHCSQWEVVTCNTAPLLCLCGRGGLSGREKIPGIVL